MSRDMADDQQKMKIVLGHLEEAKKCLESIYVDHLTQPEEPAMPSFYNELFRLVEDAYGLTHQKLYHIRDMLKWREQAKKMEEKHGASTN